MNYSSKGSNGLVYEGTIHKCPNCGEILKSFESICSVCGFEIRDNEGCVSVAKFTELLESETNEAKKIALIKSFYIPNTKESIFEFLILASTNFDAAYYASHEEVEDISDAWLTKVEQCYRKAKFSFGSDSDFSKIEEVYNEIYEAITKEKKKIERANSRKNAKKYKPLIITITAILASLFVIWIIISLITNAPQDPNLIKVGISSSDAFGEHYEDVIEILEKSGFTNIEARDDGWNLFAKPGSVKSISINGDKEFSSWDRFDKDAVVVILYNS